MNECEWDAPWVFCTQPMVAFLTKYPGHHFNKCFKLAAGKIGNWASRTKARGQNQPYWPIFCNEPSAAIQAHRQGAGVETFHWNSQPQQFLLHDWVGKGAHTWWSLGGRRVSLKKEAPQFPHIYGDKTDVGSPSLWAAQKWQSVWNSRPQKEDSKPGPLSRPLNSLWTMPAGCSAFMLVEWQNHVDSVRRDLNNSLTQVLKTRWVPSQSNISPATTVLLESSVVNLEGVTLPDLKMYAIMKEIHKYWTALQLPVQHKTQKSGGR